MTSLPTLFVHVGPSHHGVTRYGTVLADAARRTTAIQSIWLQSPSWLDRLAAAVAIARPAAVHLQFTDGIYGCDPRKAAESWRAILEVARPAMTSVTLHDVPDVDADTAPQLERQSAYRHVAESADVVVVCSHHEAQLVTAIANAHATVIPHFVETRACDRPARTYGVGVLGFLYPGKGHAAVVAACGRMPDPAEVVAIGGPSPCHQALADELVALARDLAVPLRITGWVDDDALGARMARIAVPVVANTHSSASGSLATWIGSHRRPLVGAGPYADEVTELAPGCLTPYALGDPDALGNAIHAARRDPDGTWQDAVPDHLHPDWIAARHIGLFESVT